jgi:hypothetical protein
VAPPVWLRLTRTGDIIRAYASTGDTVPWTLVGEQTLPGLPETVYWGEAVTSHVDGTVATATFDAVALNWRTFESADIGAVGHAGTTQLTPTAITIEGGGADIWNNADAFRYYHTPTATAGDSDLQVTVSSVENVNAWTKAGLMFRETLAANAKQVMLVVTPGKGIALQYRDTTGGASAQVAAVPGAAPTQLRLRKNGSNFLGYYYDASGEHFVGSISVPMSGTTIFGGIPVTSHDNGTLATAVFTGLTVF